MKLDETEKIVFLILIAGRKQKDALLSALSEEGIHIVNIMYGKGTVKASYLKDILGLVPEENKAVITCLLTQGKADRAMQMVTGKFDFTKPNTGIACTIPVDRLSF